MDVGSPTSRADYSFDHGPAIRFVCDLDPTGPHAKNALPGGETFDPASPGSPTAADRYLTGMAGGEDGCARQRSHARRVPTPFH